MLKVLLDIKDLKVSKGGMVYRDAKDAKVSTDNMLE